jgi:hypothetical protein
MENYILTILQLDGIIMMYEWYLDNKKEKQCLIIKIY